MAATSGLGGVNDGRAPGLGWGEGPAGRVRLTAVSSEPLNLEVVDRSPDHATARLWGDLDIVTSEDVKRELAQLLDDGARTLALDLADVGFVDSSGLGVLVALHRHAEAVGGRFVVRSVPPPVQRLFEITRLGDLLTIDGG